MKRRRTKKKPSAADLLASPPPTTSSNQSPSESPKQFEFNIGAFNTASSSKRNKKDGGSSSPLNQTIGSPPQHLKSLSTISDLKEMSSSRLDSIKRHLERSHSEILKDIEASQSRLHKRFKIQTQACQQVVDEAEKEYKKMSGRISESRETLKASYLEIIAEAQASASRVCKNSIPVLSQSFEKAMDVLRRRYGTIAI